MDPLISARRPVLERVKKKRTCQIVDLALSADYRVTMKESKKRDKYRELEKIWVW